MAWGKPDVTLPLANVGESVNIENRLDRDIIIGVDAGSPDGDKTIIACGNTIIGESVELTIPTEPWKSKTIKAIKVGDLAIYFGDEPDIGLVIHVPTLTKFDRAIPDCPSPDGYTQEQLISWCWKVQQFDAAKWIELSKFNNDNYATIPEVLLNSVKEYCLSIKLD